MSFHAWKIKQIAEDTASNGGRHFLRPKLWYYQAYGRYLENVRKGED